MSSLIDPLVEKDGARRAASCLALPRGDICACFSENKYVRPSVAYVCTFLLRPCGADRRMRFSRAPAYPSRDYLGRESSSLPRSFSSLLPIRGGARYSSWEDRATALVFHSRHSRHSCAFWKTTVDLYNAIHRQKMTPKRVGAAYPWDTCRLKVSENRDVRHTLNVLYESSY